MDGPRQAQCVYNTQTPHHTSCTAFTGKIECPPTEGRSFEDDTRCSYKYHRTTCEYDEVACACPGCMRRMCRSLPEHEAFCPSVKIECPNEGCSFTDERAWMTLSHSHACGYEEVLCPCPKCESRLLRKDLDAHVRDCHLQQPEMQLQHLWRENARLTASSESKLRRAAGSPTSRVFNWQTNGWGGGDCFDSDTFTFGGGLGQEGGGQMGCCLHLRARAHCGHGHLLGHYIEFYVNSGGEYKMHATFSVLDKHDNILRQVCEIGTTDTPRELVDGCAGDAFKVTEEEKAQSVRADGSCRVLAVVQLFLA